MTATGVPFSNLPRVPADDDAWNLPIAPPGNLEAGTLARIARSDFETTWDALVERSKTDEDFGGGNFMFSLLAMVYLELACRTAAANSSGLVLSQFSDRLAEIEPRYFTPLPGPVRAPNGFELPSRPGVAPDQHMLALIFDLARNGQSHMYQQICVSLDRGDASRGPANAGPRWREQPAATC